LTRIYPDARLQVTVIVLVLIRASVLLQDSQLLPGPRSIGFDTPLLAARAIAKELESHLR